VAAERFQAEIDGLVELTIAGTGAVRGVAEAQQVRAVAARLLRAAELATAPLEQGMPPRETGRALAAGVVVREPVGVVACITPFNFPMTNCAGKIGPALACGNTVVVKPSPVDPLGVAELCRIYDTFTRRLAAAGPTLRIGDPREPGVVVGPLVSAAQRTRVERFITRGREEGATVACGGRRPSHLARGYYVEPTLFTGARNDMTIAPEEIFGPVITAIPFRHEAEAIALANDSDYGLYGYVWTGDAARGLRVARAVRTGTIQINGSPLNPDAPFGGYKLSGV